MRNSLLALSLVLLSVMTFAQPPGGGRQGGQMPTGRFYGKVVEAKSGKPIEYASVQLLQNRMDTATKKRQEVVVAGMITKANGEFTLENVAAMGQSKLKITIVGFKSFEQTVSFDLKPGTDMMGALDKDLGNVKIEFEEKVLDNVVVTAEKPGLVLGIDRKVFNVDKNLVSVGGTAVDIMRNVPSLNVDIDGNVSLRNNSPQIFVDGRPTTLELDQIPADAIESVEIITNPSAKFDASGGTAGILNIVLKKNRKVGYNGSIRANVDSRGRVGLGTDINIRQSKINAFASLNFNQRKSKSTGTTDRLSFATTPDYFLHQKDKSEFDGSFIFARAGLDYFITNRTTLSGSFNIASGNFKSFNSNDLFVDTLLSPVVTSLTKRVSRSERENKNTGGSLNFKHNFPKQGHEWTADINYRGRSGPNTNRITTDVYNLDHHTINNSILQNQTGNSKSNNVTLQSDYANPLSENSKIELGIRAEFNSNTSDNAYYNVNPATGMNILPATSVVSYTSDDRVLAAYATFSNRIKNFGCQLGLRGESSNYKGNLTLTDEKFNIDYAISLFPSVFLNQKLRNDQELQLNYSRRINRPNFWQLTPFIDSTDILNPSIGNPGLKPEFTNSIEFSYQKMFKNRSNFLASIYYKNTNDLISRFQEVREDPSTGKEQLISTFVNANSSFVTGLELTLRNNIAKWWELTTNFNLFTSKIDIDDPTVAEQDQFASWFAKVNNTFKASKKLSFQFSGNYQSKSVLPPGGSGGGGGRGGGFGGFGQTSTAQGYVRPVFYFDAGVRYTFLKEDRASLSLNINDMFRTRISDIHSETAGYIQDVTRRRDPQVVRLNFNWRFGKFDPNLFKRKNNKNQNNEGGMDGMNMGQ